MDASLSSEEEFGDSWRWSILAKETTIMTTIKADQKGRRGWVESATQGTASERKREVDWEREMVENERFRGKSCGLESKKIAANESEEERERVGAQTIYIDTSLLSHQRVRGQREHFLAPSLFKTAHEIEKCWWQATQQQKVHGANKYARAWSGARFLASTENSKSICHLVV